MKSPSEKSQYKSPFDNEYCTAAQYITQIIVSRLMIKRGVVPVNKFWMLKEWRPVFVRQVKRAYQLLAIYDEQAIINAINEPDALWIYSLFMKELEIIITHEQEKLTEINERANKCQEQYPDFTLSQPR